MKGVNQTRFFRNILGGIAYVKSHFEYSVHNRANIKLIRTSLAQTKSERGFYLAPMIDMVFEIIQPTIGE